MNVAQAESISFADEVRIEPLEEMSVGYQLLVRAVRLAVLFCCLPALVVGVALSAVAMVVWKSVRFVDWLIGSGTGSPLAGRRLLPVVRLDTMPTVH
jgi:hypothetical protein